jgi:uncharacterized protein (TIGR00269 family)
VKCRRCGGRAVLELRRHNTALCADDYLGFFRRQVQEAIRRGRMFTRDEAVLVAVSGGKDSLALWDVLLGDGYRAVGVYIDLGIYDYSARSRACCEAFAAERGAALHVVSVAEAVGAPIPAVRETTRRPTCSACGLSKRYILNRTALERGYAVVATGHNLDDEAATLLGSTLRWETAALARQTPVLESTHPRLARRVKPLYRLSERETAAYAFLRGIDYVVEECPFARGATSLAHKDLLNRLEDTSPGSKAMFFLNFLEQARPLFQAQDATPLTECVRCGQATTGEVCAFCRLAEQVRQGGRATPAAPTLPEPDAAPLRGLASDLTALAELTGS